MSALVGVGAVVLAAFTAVASPAQAAEGPGAVDTTTGTVPPLPGTTRVVDSWKLAGIPGVAGASGVEIAPNWILTAHHNVPSVGMSFRNWLGTSTVDAVFVPAGAPNSGGGFSCEATGGPDIALSHLATALPTPAGGFPSLLADPLPTGGLGVGSLPSAATAANAALATLPGYALAAGEGGFIGHIKTIWSNTANEAVADTTQFAQAIGGDSGGPVFWYPSATSAPILSNLMVYAAPPFGQSSSQFAGSCGLVSDITAFMTSTFAKYPANSSPSYVTLNSVAPTSSYLPLQAAPITPTTAGGTATSVGFDLAQASAPAGWVTPAISSYRVALIPPSGSGLPTATATVSAAAVSSGSGVNVTGLTTDVTYKVQVTSYTASGIASAPLNGASVTPRIAPNALVVLKTEAYGYTQGATLQTCVHIAYTAAASGPTPTARVLYGPNLFDIQPWGSGTTQVIDRCGLTPSKSYIWYLGPLNDNSLGPISYIRFTTPAGTTAQPNNVDVPGIGSNCMLGTWSAPNAPMGGGTLLSYTVTVYNPARGNAGSTVIENIPVTTTSKLICGLPSATHFTFGVFANWDRTDIPGMTSAFTGFTTS